VVSGGVGADELERVTQLLEAVLPASALILRGAAQDPHLIAASPAHGLIAFDLITEPLAEASRTSVTTADGRLLANPLVSFAPKMERLREMTSGAADVPLHAAVLATQTDTATLTSFARALPPRLVVGCDRLQEVLTEWHGQVDQTAFAELQARLAPVSSLEATLADVLDPGRDERENLRLRLDEQQSKLAGELGSGVAIVEGVAGSGKSLVLAARAQQLASEHPDWDIDVVCYNRTLVPYLAELIGDHENVWVDTVTSWMSGRGVSQPNFRAEDFDEKLRHRIEQAIDAGTGTDSCDAMLVDEAQDLTPEMLALLRSAVRADRGGMLVVRDLSQSLYRESRDVLETDDPQRVVLTRNYRNTGRVGRFALRSVFGTGRSDAAARDPRRPVEPEFTSEGEKVQVVWGDSWDDQAAFVAREARRLVDEGVVAWEDIGVLYTQYRGQTKRLVAELEQADVPHVALTWDRDSRRDFSLSAPGVKLLTVHSAKGLEFPVVFLFGVEALRVPDSLVDAEETEANFTRVAYVGMTRAKDLLYLTYTRPNAIVSRCLALADDAEFRRYPDDYATEAARG
jgi:hypothetical protein